MTLDYFEYLRGILKFDDPEYFYYIDVVKRITNNRYNWTATPDNDKRAKHQFIKGFCVSSLEDFNNIETEVKSLCHAVNARAYISMTRKTYFTIKNKLMSLCDEFKAKHEFPRAVDTYDIFYLNNDDDIVDFVCIDFDDDTALPENMQKYIDVVLETTPNAKVIGIIDTPHGKFGIFNWINIPEYNKRIDELGYRRIGVGYIGGIPLYCNLVDKFKDSGIIYD